jgi:hypothetical protein
MQSIIKSLQACAEPPLCTGCNRSFVWNLNMNSQSEHRRSRERGEVRPGLLVSLGLLLAVVIGATVLYRYRGASHPPATTQPAGVQSDPPQANATAPTSDPSESTPVAPVPSGSVEPATPETPVTKTARAATTVAATPRPVPTAETRQLVALLSRLDAAKSPWTPEVAVKWKENLQQLIQQGAAGVPAILEFLDKNTDVTFAGPGSQLTGYGSARAAMIDALVQIGGAEGISGTLQALQTMGDPHEIAVLAQNLEKLAPEQYRQEALAAARETLGMAAAGKLQGSDVAPLFEVLQRYGGPEVVAELEQAAGQWKYYSTVALAQLPEGAGVPALIRLAQQAQSSGARDSALQMLAMLSSQNPDARVALLQQAAQNTIPPSAWHAIAPFLAGDAIRFVDSGFDGPVEPGNVQGLKSTHIQFGNQNFYSAPMLLSPEELTQRLALIDEVLAVNSNPAVKEPLQQSRDALSARLAQAQAPPALAPK